MATTTHRRGGAAAANPSTRAPPPPTPAAADSPAPILVVLNALLSIWASGFKGAWCALRGCFLALQNLEVCTRHYTRFMRHTSHQQSINHPNPHNTTQVRRIHRQIIIPLAAMAIPAYILLLLPARLLLHHLLRLPSLANALSHYSAAAARLVPLAINLALRFIYYRPLDTAYLAVLTDLDPALAQKLGALPARSYKEAMWKEARRVVRLLSFLPLYAFLSLIPVIGRVLKWAFKVR